MTPDMAFEGLIVSHDDKVLGTMNRLLGQLSISTNICLNAPRALDYLSKGNTDLLIIDCEDDDGPELLSNFWKTRVRKKPTVVAVSPSNAGYVRAQLILQKPIVEESAAKSLKTAYSHMLHDYRAHARYAVMTSVSARIDMTRVATLTVIDIAEGGVGISSKEQLPVGSRLQFRLRLPATSREILLESRVLWGREYGRYGCEFLSMPPVDRDILREWLRNKVRIKKPLVDL